MILKIRLWMLLTKFLMEILVHIEVRKVISDYELAIIEFYLRGSKTKLCLLQLLKIVVKRTRREFDYGLSYENSRKGCLP